MSLKKLFLTQIFFFLQEKFDQIFFGEEKKIIPFGFFKINFYSPPPSHPCSFPLEIFRFNLSLCLQNTVLCTDFQKLKRAPAGNHIRSKMVGSLLVSFLIVARQNILLQLSFKMCKMKNGGSKKYQQISQILNSRRQNINDDISQQNSSKFAIFLDCENT